MNIFHCPECDSMTAETFKDERTCWNHSCKVAGIRQSKPQPLSSILLTGTQYLDSDGKVKTAGVKSEPLCEAKETNGVKTNTTQTHRMSAAEAKVVQEYQELQARLKKNGWIYEEQEVAVTQRKRMNPLAILKRLVSERVEGKQSAHEDRREDLAVNRFTNIFMQPTNNKQVIVSFADKVRFDDVQRLTKLMEKEFPFYRDH